MLMPLMQALLDAVVDRGEWDEGEAERLIEENEDAMFFSIAAPAIDAIEETLSYRKSEAEERAAGI